jgi:hypothetical protein
MAATMKYKASGSFIVALVTTSGDFYSVLLLVMGPASSNEWCVGGIKKVPPLNYQQLVAQLVPVPPRPPRAGH